MVQIFEAANVYICDCIVVGPNLFIRNNINKNISFFPGFVALGDYPSACCKEKISVNIIFGFYS